VDAAVRSDGYGPEAEDERRKVMRLWLATAAVIAINFIILFTFMATPAASRATQ
jgi:hypothetical protein